MPDKRNKQGFRKDAAAIGADSPEFRKAIGVPEVYIGRGEPPEGYHPQKRLQIEGSDVEGKALLNPDLTDWKRTRQAFDVLKKYDPGITKELENIRMFDTSDTSGLLGEAGMTDKSAFLYTHPPEGDEPIRGMAGTLAHEGFHNLTGRGHSGFGRGFNREKDDIDEYGDFVTKMIPKGKYATNAEKEQYSLPEMDPFPSHKPDKYFRIRDKASDPIATYNPLDDLRYLSPSHQRKY